MLPPYGGVNLQTLQTLRVKVADVPVDMSEEDRVLASRFGVLSRPDGTYAAQAIKFVKYRNGELFSHEDQVNLTKVVVEEVAAVLDGARTLTQQGHPAVLDLICRAIVQREQRMLRGEKDWVLKGMIASALWKRKFNKGSIVAEYQVSLGSLTVFQDQGR